MKFVLPLIAAAAFAAPALAQDSSALGSREISVDFGIGAIYSPTYKGSDEFEVSPWLIMRDLRLIGAGAGEDSGFALSASFDLIGDRDEDDDDRLKGLDEIDRAVEAGLKATYNIGEISSYAALRKGFGGHHGIAGEIGAKYRFETTDRMTFWAGLQADYGNSEYSETYFGVSEDEALATDYSAYAPGGGFNEVTASLEGRYDVTDNVAIRGEVRFGLIGDAADSPVVVDKSQPSVRLGIVRTLNFGF